jgi:hypothetical protein
VIEAVQPVLESVVTTERAEESPSADVMQMGCAEAVTGSTPNAFGQKSATVIQLEQWLSSIRERRRDQATSTNNNP